MTKLEALHYIGAKGFTKRTATNIYREALSQCEVAKADIDAVINARLSITTVGNDETENE